MSHLELTGKAKWMTRETIFFFSLLLRASCPSRYLRSLEKRKKDDSLCKLQVDQNSPTLNYEKNEGINKM